MQNRVGRFMGDKADCIAGSYYMIAVVKRRGITEGLVQHVKD